MSGPGRGWSPCWGHWGCWQQSRWWTGAQCWHRQSGTGHYFSKWYKKNVRRGYFILKKSYFYIPSDKEYQTDEEQYQNYVRKRTWRYHSFFQFQNHFVKNWKTCPSSGRSNMIDSTKFLIHPRAAPKKRRQTYVLPELRAESTVNKKLFISLIESYLVVHQFS